METLVGAIRLQPPSCHCERSHRGCSPLNAVLGPTEGSKQPDVDKVAIKLTREIRYETTCELSQALTGLPLRAHTAHEVAPEVAASLGGLDVVPSREAFAATIAAVAATHTWRPILVLGIDGADGPTRPETANSRRRGRKRARAKCARWTGEWRAAKGFRCYLSGRRALAGPSGRLASRGAGTLVCDGGWSALDLEAGAGAVPIGGGDFGQLPLP